MAYKMKRYPAGYFKNIADNKTQYNNEIESDFGLTGTGLLVTNIVNYMSSTYYDIANNDDTVVDIVYSEAPLTGNKLMFFVRRSSKYYNQCSDKSSPNGPTGDYCLCIYKANTNTYSGRTNLGKNVLTHNAQSLSIFQPLRSGINTFIPYTDIYSGPFEGLYVSPFKFYNTVSTSATIVINNKKYLIAPQLGSRSDDWYSRLIIFYESQLDN